MGRKKGEDKQKVVKEDEESEAIAKEEVTDPLTEDAVPMEEEMISNKEEGMDDTTDVWVDMDETNADVDSKMESGKTDEGLEGDEAEEEHNPYDPPTVADEDYQKEFTIIGQHEFTVQKKIKVTSSWIAEATLFPSSLETENLTPLSALNGLSPKMVEAWHQIIKNWFPVQNSVLPTILRDLRKPSVLRPRDIAIAAPTGSGKTLCYIVPCLSAVGEKPRGVIVAVVVVPVQTLVHQVEQEFLKFNVCGAKILALSGKGEYEKERKKLIGVNGKTVADIIIATPDRLMKHLTDTNGTVDLTRTRFIIADEADSMSRLLRWEWLELLESRTGNLGAARAVTLHDITASRCSPMKILLSATLSKDVEELHAWNLHRPRLFQATASQSKEIAVDNDKVSSGRISLPQSITHTIICCPSKLHPLAVYNAVSSSDWKRVLVFTNQRQSSFRLAHVMSHLAGESFKVEQLTADLFGNRRAKVLKRFVNGTTRVLVCSDILSRGVDVVGIDCVINYDIPSHDRLFVHRAGRTGRAGNEGSVITVTDQKTKRPFMLMLKTNDLWTNVKEQTVVETDLEEHMEQYRASLASLQKVTEEKGEDKHTRQKLPQPKRQKRKLQHNGSSKAQSQNQERHEKPDY